MREATLTTSNGATTRWIRRTAGLLLLVSLAALVAVPATAGLASVTVGVSPAAPHGVAAHAAPMATVVPGANVHLGYAFPALGVPFSAHSVPYYALHPQLAGVTPAPSSTPLAPTPKVGGSTSANFYLQNSDCASWGTAPPRPAAFGGSSATAVGTSNTTLVVAGGSNVGWFNGSGGTLCSVPVPSTFFFSHGMTGLFRSTDSGQTWTDSWLRQATPWTTLTSPTNGSINYGNPTVVSDKNGNLLVSELAINNCFFNYSGCSNTTGFVNDWAIAVAHSGNGGASWGTPLQLDHSQAIHYLTIPSTCASAGLASGFYYYKIPEVPSVAIDWNGPVAGGTAVATWDIFNIAINTATCTVTATAQVRSSVSLNGGASWSAPKNLSSNLADTSRVVFGPGKVPAITVMFADFQNTSTAGFWSWEVTRSVNNGTSWSTPHDLAVNDVNAVSISYPDSFGSATVPVLASDRLSPAYAGHEYLVWQDNQSGTNAGYPTIMAAVSTDNGTTWATPVQIANPSRSATYFEPAVSVAPNGNVWVTYYGISYSGGNYNLYGVLSTNGGTSWSPQFILTDGVSTPGSAILDIGLWTGLAATTNGAFPVFTDCRAAACASSGDTSLFTANPHPVTISSNAPGVSATVTTFGAQSTMTLPATIGWDNVSSHSVSVPQYVPDPTNSSDVYGFSGFSGVNTTTNYQTTFTYSGKGSALNANYVAVPAAILKGTLTPNVAGASVKVNNVAVGLTTINPTTLQYSDTVASGYPYTITASAGAKYAPQTVVQPTSGGRIYWNNFTLIKTAGYINGSVSPMTGVVLTVNGTDQSSKVNPSTGLFSITQPWGWYWVNASSNGFTSFSQYYQVNPGQATTVRITLYGGNITGAVAPPRTGLVVKLDGLPVPVTAGVFDILNIPGGYHNMTATQTGYNLSVIHNIHVVPGQNTVVNITLTNRGWISGTIAPFGVKSLILHIFNVTTGTGNYFPVAANGSFNATQLVSFLTYTINVTAPGYHAYQNKSYVTPGNGSSFQIALKACATANCVAPCTTNCPPPPCTGSNCPGNGSTTVVNGISTTTVLVIVAVVVLAAVVAVVLITRRGRGGGGMAPPPEQPVYDETPTSELPKLQSDGSMGPGGPSG